MKTLWAIFGSFNFESRHMKHFIGFLMVVALATACQDIDPATDLTGYETTYELVAASVHDVKGIVTFQERIDGFTNVVIKLRGTGGEATHPVHLHLGDLSTPDADVAALLSPVAAKTGNSSTLLKSLGDETPITYKELSALKACIKVHLSDSGPERDIVLAGGNIGDSYVKSISQGKPNGFPGCKSGGN
jgi:hypothetical protein